MASDIVQKEAAAIFADFKMMSRRGAALWLSQQPAWLRILRSFRAALALRVRGLVPARCERALTRWRAAPPRHTQPAGQVFFL
jgi:hypothetical protein